MTETTTPTAGNAPSAAAPAAGEAAEALKALAHPVRLEMVRMLAERGGELCVCHLGEAFDLAQPTISHHLKRLRQAGLVDSRKDGTWVHHRIRPEAVAGLAALLGGWAEEASLDDGC